MTGPLRELRDFASAALVTPVPRDHTETPAVRRRRQIIVTITYLAGLVCLWGALQVPPGDPLFYVATFALAAIWVLGALAAGPLHLGRGHTRAGTPTSRGIVQGLLLGLILLVIYCAGAVVVAKIPVLRDPVLHLLDHARLGSLPLVVLITAVNGIAEEIYFRGALYASLPRAHAVLLSTLLYALVTAAGGVPLLVLAGLTMGTLTGLQRRVTGGIAGPIVSHLVWSIGMLLLLPPLLEYLR